MPLRNVRLPSINLRGLGTCSFAHRLFAHSLRSLRSSERLWAIRSVCSGPISNCEQIAQVAQVAHDKWANHTFFELTKKERFAQKKFNNIVFLCTFLKSFFVSLKNDAHFLFLVINVSKLLRLLTKNEWPWANHSGRSPKMSEWANRSFFWSELLICSFIAKNVQFAKKTDEQIPNPANRNYPLIWNIVECTIW